VDFVQRRGITSLKGKVQKELLEKKGIWKGKIGEKTAQRMNKTRHDRRSKKNVRLK
jgi:hypothetical protein